MKELRARRWASALVFQLSIGPGREAHAIALGALDAGVNLVFISVAWSTPLNAVKAIFVSGNPPNQPAPDSKSGRNECIPAILGNARNDAEARRAKWPDHRRFALGEIRLAGDGAERVAMADDGHVGARWWHGR